MSPDTDVVSDADYLKYFKLTATSTAVDNYLVCAELDAAKIDLDKTVVSFAAPLSTGVEGAAVVDGEAILTIPAPADKGFFIIDPKLDVPSDRSGRPDTADIQHD